MIPLQTTMYGKIIARETIKGFKTVCNLRHALGKCVYLHRYRGYKTLNNQHITLERFSQS